MKKCSRYSIAYDRTGERLPGEKENAIAFIHRFTAIPFL